MALSSILGASSLLINSSSSSSRLGASSGVGPVGLDAEADGLMADPVWSKELITWIRLLPSGGE